MGEIIRLDDHRPQVVIDCDDDRVRVVPEKTLREFADGKRKSLPKIVLRRIVEEWLDRLPTMRK